MEGAGTGGATGRHTGARDEMPGRVTMDQPGAIAGDDLKKGQQHTSEDIAPSIGAPVQPHAAPLLNGDLSNGRTNNALNGTSTVNGALPNTNGGQGMVNAALSNLKTPPELDQSWREGAQNKRLGTLLERLAQQCYFELNETLTKMQEVQMPPQAAPQANGVVPHSVQDTSEASLQKKRMLLDWAHDQRDRFTKTLILSDWSRIEKDMARLIDIKVWQDKQRFAHEHARFAIGQIKVDTVPAKMPNPNIDGAIELLATGKASWVPDFGYVPPKRLSAKQLLRTLRDMNVLLATRLNLHDELPPHMKDFTIADGRATFTVPGEFEVDLSVADEDPASPFYFIDIRLLFTPSSGALDERLRGFLEGKVNEALATKRLQGCYDFLHNFVLTHKINVLRSQAQDMVIDKWFECVKYENLRRSLTLQYWADMPGPKSWIEIGIDSGKEKGSSRTTSTPKLSVRSFRKGAETVNEQIDVDWQDLDLEKMAMAVIANHSYSILSSMKERILATAPGSKSVSLKLTDPDASTASPSLSLELPSLQVPITVKIEPITGKFSITPRTRVTTNAENRLNSEASIDGSRWLVSVLCAVAQERMSKQAELLGWLAVTNRARQDLSQIFGAEAQQHSLYSCSEGWGPNWALAVTFSLFGEKWWIAKLEEKPDSNNVLRKHVKFAKQLSVGDTAEKQQLLTRESMLRIERLAVAEVSFNILKQELKTNRIPHVIENPALMPETLAGNNSRQLSAAVYMRFPALMREQRGKSWKPWALDYVRLTQHGIVSGSGIDGKPAVVRHNLRLTLQKNKMKNLQARFDRTQDKDLAFKAPDGMAIRVRTLFGEPLLSQIQDRLVEIEKLDRRVGILTKHNFECTTVSQKRLAFAYNSALQLGAQLLVRKGATRLKLEPAENPHLRLRVLLEQGLNGHQGDYFETFAQILPFTLPVMRAFDHIESLHLKQRTISIHVHNVTNYSLQYRAPMPRCAFEVRGRTRLENGRPITSWFIAVDKKKTDTKALSPEYLQAISELWKTKGDNWNGIGNSVIADVQGVQTALQKLDEVVRRFESPETAAKPSTTKPTQADTVKSKSTTAEPNGQNNQEIIMLD